MVAAASKADKSRSSRSSTISSLSVYEVKTRTNLRNRQQQEEARKHILSQILHPEAADRLGRIRLVKEQRATDVENRLIMLAQSGQLKQKVTESQLKDILNAVADNKEEEKIVVNRRKVWDDDDDDDLLDL